MATVGLKHRNQKRFRKMFTSPIRKFEERMLVKSVVVPPGLEALMEGLTKEVLKKQPQDICQFAADYFATLIYIRDEAGVEFDFYNSPKYNKLKTKSLNDINVPKEFTSYEIINPKDEVELLANNSIPQIDLNRLNVNNESDYAINSSGRHRSEASTAEIDKIQNGFFQVKGLIENEQNFVDEVEKIDNKNNIENVLDNLENNEIVKELEKQIEKEETIAQNEDKEIENNEEKESKIEVMKISPGKNKELVLEVETQIEKHLPESEVGEDETDSKDIFIDEVIKTKIENNTEEEMENKVKDFEINVENETDLKNEEEIEEKLEEINEEVITNETKEEIEANKENDIVEEVETLLDKEQIENKVQGIEEVKLVEDNQNVITEINNEIVNDKNLIQNNLENGINNIEEEEKNKDETIIAEDVKIINNDVEKELLENQDTEKNLLKEINNLTENIEENEIEKEVEAINEINEEKIEQNTTEEDDKSEIFNEIKGNEVEEIIKEEHVIITKNDEEENFEEQKASEENIINMDETTEDANIYILENEEEHRIRKRSIISSSPENEMNNLNLPEMSDIITTPNFNEEEEEKNTLFKESEAAIRIQSLWRGYLHRKQKNVNAITITNDSEGLVKAATVIQTLWRGYNTRKYFSQRNKIIDDQENIEREENNDLLTSNEIKIENSDDNEEEKKVVFIIGADDYETDSDVEDATLAKFELAENIVDDVTKSAEDAIKIESSLNLERSQSEIIFTNNGEDMTEIENNLINEEKTNNSPGYKDEIQIADEISADLNKLKAWISTENQLTENNTNEINSDEANNEIKEKTLEADEEILKNSMESEELEESNIVSNLRCLNTTEYNILQSEVNENDTLELAKNNKIEEIIEQEYLQSKSKENIKEIKEISLTKMITEQLEHSEEMLNEENTNETIEDKLKTGEEIIMKALGLTNNTDSFDSSQINENTKLKSSSDNNILENEEIKDDSSEVVEYTRSTIDENINNKTKECLQTTEENINNITENYQTEINTDQLHHSGEMHDSLILNENIANEDKLKAGEEIIMKALGLENFEEIANPTEIVIDDTNPESNNIVENEEEIKNNILEIVDKTEYNIEENIGNEVKNSLQSTEDEINIITENIVNEVIDTKQIFDESIKDTLDSIENEVANISENVLKNGSEAIEKTVEEIFDNNKDKVDDLDSSEKKINPEVNNLNEAVAEIRMECPVNFTETNEKLEEIDESIVELSNEINDVSEKETETSKNIKELVENNQITEDVEGINDNREKLGEEIIKKIETITEELHKQNENILEAANNELINAEKEIKNEADNAKEEIVVIQYISKDDFKEVIEDTIEDINIKLKNEDAENEQNIIENDELEKEDLTENVNENVVENLEEFETKQNEDETTNDIEENIIKEKEDEKVENLLSDDIPSNNNEEIETNKITEEPLNNDTENVSEEILNLEENVGSAEDQETENSNREVIVTKKSIDECADNIVIKKTNDFLNTTENVKNNNKIEENLDENLVDIESTINNIEDNSTEDSILTEEFLNNSIEYKGKENSNLEENIKNIKNEAIDKINENEIDTIEDLQNEVEETNDLKTSLMETTNIIAENETQLVENSINNSEGNIREEIITDNINENNIEEMKEDEEIENSIKKEINDVEGEVKDGIKEIANNIEVVQENLEDVEINAMENETVTEANNLKEEISETKEDINEIVNNLEEEVQTKENLEDFNITENLVTNEINDTNEEISERKENIGIANSIEEEIKAEENVEEAQINITENETTEDLMKNEIIISNEEISETKDAIKEIENNFEDEAEEKNNLETAEIKSLENISTENSIQNEINHSNDEISETKEDAGIANINEEEIKAEESVGGVEVDIMENKNVDDSTKNEINNLNEEISETKDDVKEITNKIEEETEAKENLEETEINMTDNEIDDNSLKNSNINKQEDEDSGNTNSDDIQKQIIKTTEETEDKINSEIQNTLNEDYIEESMSTEQEDIENKVKETVAEENLLSTIDESRNNLEHSAINEEMKYHSEIEIDPEINYNKENLDENLKIDTEIKQNDLNKNELNNDISNINTAEDLAATKIQSSWRGHRVRRSIEKKELSNLQKHSECDELSFEKEENTEDSITNSHANETDTTETDSQITVIEKMSSSEDKDDIEKDVEELNQRLQKLAKSSAYDSSSDDSKNLKIIDEINESGEPVETTPQEDGLDNFNSSRYDLKVDDMLSPSKSKPVSPMEELVTAAYKIGARLSINDDKIVDAIDNKDEIEEKAIEYIRIPLHGPNLPVVENKIVKNDSVTNSTDYVYIPLNPPGGIERTETTVSLHHSGEMHDSLGYPYEDPAEETGKVGDDTKTNDTDLNPSGLLHSGEMHDSLVLAEEECEKQLEADDQQDKNVAKQLVNNNVNISNIINNHSTRLQFSGEMHDSLESCLNISQNNNNQETDYNDNEEKENNLQHSGELHDSLETNVNLSDYTNLNNTFNINSDSTLQNIDNSSNNELDINTDMKSVSTGTDFDYEQEEYEDLTIDTNLINNEPALETIPELEESNMITNQNEINKEETNENGIKLDSEDEKLAFNDANNIENIKHYSAENEMKTEDGTSPKSVLAEIDAFLERNKSRSPGSLSRQSNIETLTTNDNIDSELKDPSTPTKLSILHSELSLEKENSKSPLSQSRLSNSPNRELFDEIDSIIESYEQKRQSSPTESVRSLEEVKDLMEKHLNEGSQNVSSDNENLHALDDQEHLLENEAESSKEEVLNCLTYETHKSRSQFSVDCVKDVSNTNLNEDIQSPLEHNIMEETASTSINSLNQQIKETTAIDNNISSYEGDASNSNVDKINESYTSQLKHNINEVIEETVSSPITSLNQIIEQAPLIDDNNYEENALNSNVDKEDCTLNKEEISSSNNFSDPQIGNAPLVDNNINDCAQNVSNLNVVVLNNELNEEMKNTIPHNYNNDKQNKNNTATENVTPNFNAESNSTVNENRNIEIPEESSQNLNEEIVSNISIHNAEEAIMNSTLENSHLSENLSQKLQNMDESVKDFNTDKTIDLLGMVIPCPEEISNEENNKEQNINPVEVTKNETTNNDSSDYSRQNSQNSQDSITKERKNSADTNKTYTIYAVSSPEDISSDEDIVRNMAASKIQSSYRNYRKKRATNHIDNEIVRKSTMEDKYLDDSILYDNFRNNSVEELKDISEIAHQTVVNNTIDHRNLKNRHSLENNHLDTIPETIFPTGDDTNEEKYLKESENIKDSKIENETENILSVKQQTQLNENDNEKSAEEERNETNPEIFDEQSQLNNSEKISEENSENKDLESSKFLQVTEDVLSHNATDVEDLGATTSGIQSESSIYDGDESDAKSSPDDNLGQGKPQRGQNDEEFDEDDFNEVRTETSTTTVVPVQQHSGDINDDTVDIFLSSDELSQAGAEMLTSHKAAVKRQSSTCVASKEKKEKEDLRGIAQTHYQRGASSTSTTGGGEAGGTAAAAGADNRPPADMETAANTEQINSTRTEFDNRRMGEGAQTTDEQIAATKIQAGFRGYQVRKQMKNKKTPNEEQKAGKRNNSGRRRNPDHPPKNSSDLEEKSATKIQAGIRGFLVRKRQRNAKDKQA